MSELRRRGNRVIWRRLVLDSPISRRRKSGVPSERHRKPAPRSATARPSCRRNLRSVERCREGNQGDDGTPTSGSDVQQGRRGSGLRARAPRGRRAHSSRWSHAAPRGGEAVHGKTLSQWPQSLRHAGTQTCSMPTAGHQRDGPGGRVWKVAPRESRPQGEGAQVTGHRRPGGMRNAERRNGPGCPP